MATSIVELIDAAVAAANFGTAAAVKRGRNPNFPYVPVIAYGDKDRLIKTAHVVCELLDDGANWQTIEAEIVIHHGSGRSDEGYHAAWFEQYAVYHYCHRHSDKLGVI